MTNIRNKILELHLEKFSGRLRISKDSVRKIIFFKNGNPTYVESTVRSEALGQVLLSQGKISQDQFGKVLSIMEKTGRRQGEIIVEQGFLTGFQVFEALKTQVVTKFQNCFLMGECECVAEKGEGLLKDLPEYPFNFLRAYLDIAVDSEPTELQDEAMKRAPKVLPQGLIYIQQNPIHPKETRWLRMMDGRRTLENILGEFPGDDREIIALVHVFSALRMMELVDTLPQKFQRKAVDVYKETPTEPITKPISESSKVDITQQEHLKTANTLYTFALDIDLPYHRLLRIPKDAPKGQVKLAYDDLIRKMKLDTLETTYTKEAEVVLANKVFEQLILAYTVLSDPKRRDEYYKNSAGKHEKIIPPPKVVAEVHFQKAKIFLSKRKYEEAEKEIRKSIELDPEESTYQVELASLFMVVANTKKVEIPQTAEQALKQALKLNSSNLEAFFQLGIYYKQKNELEKARGAYQKMLEIKPNEPRASSEIRLLVKRIGEKGHESAFSNLFKKKEDPTKKGKKSDKDNVD